MFEPKTIKIVILAIFAAIVIISFIVYRNKRKEIALALLSLFFSLCIAEIFLRLVYPQISEHDEMFKYDSYLGWTFIPNRGGKIIYVGEVHNYIKTNSLGFRDNQPSSDYDGMRKILILGDSFVSNLSVRDNDVFTEIMEQELSNTSVLNFGVNGYAQTQEYLLLIEQLDKVNPHLVILVIYVRNDFYENMGGYWLYPRPIASWSENNSTLNILPTPAYVAENSTLALVRNFFKQLHIYELFDRGLWNLMNQILTMKRSEYKPSIYTPPELYLCRKDLSENTIMMYRTMEELLLRISRFVEERGIQMVFVIAPSIIQVEDKLWFATLRKYGEQHRDYMVSLPNEKLMRFAKQNNLLMIDLLPIFRLETDRGKILYNHREQHWNGSGNRVVAHALLDYLRSSMLGFPIKK